MKRWEADASVPGLGVMALPSGVRTWYVRFRDQDGKQHTKKLGRAEVLNRVAARREALKLLALAAQGQAPAKPRDEPTVADLQRLMERRHYPNLRPKTVKNYEQLWRLHILPAIGRKKITAVQRRDVLELLDPVPPVQRNRALQCLKAAFTMAEVWQLRPEGTNPCRKVSKVQELVRERYLSDEERERLVAALDAMATTPLRWRFTQLIKLLMLTGCRVGEVCRGRWEWGDEQAAVIVIPAERHKTGKQTGKKRVVHAPPAAIHILRELRLKSNSDWIIAGEGDGPLVGYPKLWNELKKKAGIQDLKVHDLRHNWASVAITKAGLTLPQVGSLLGHASPVTTARYAHLVDQGARSMAASVADQLGL